MKKPLLLLVDDDRAVLEALESALAPVFEEVARVEAFEAPIDVLAALPRWIEEGRPIAVAIVDQKMPGMTGVELLMRLRGEAPATHMQAILLTGYAGLDSALAAKNEAGSQRYLEKPWSPAQLIDETWDLMRAHLTASGAAHHFVFREVREGRELRDHLRLRYEVYRATAGIHNVLPSDGSLDLDAYDAVSQFLSLFEHDINHERQIGTLRVALRTPAPAAATLAEIAEGIPGLVERLHSPRAEPFPLMTYLVDRDAVAALVERCEAAGEPVGEPGRLTLVPGMRGAAGAAGALPLARHIIEASTSFFFFFFFSIHHAILTCIPAHTRFYRPLGFKEAEGTTTKLQPRLGVELACLHGESDAVPSPVRERVLAMARCIGGKGGTCHCPTFPDCLPGPYETGDFRGVDLFCPLQATRLLSERQLN